LRRMILQLMQIFLTDERTFMMTTPLFIPVGDPAFREIVGRQLDRDLVAHQDLDEVHAHFPRNMREHGVPVFKAHLEHCVGQCLGDHAIHFYRTLFRHN
jgi:hypothetical protein